MLVERFLVASLAVMSLGAPATAAATDPAEVPIVRADRALTQHIIVLLEVDNAPGAVETALTDMGYRVVDELPLIDALIVETPDGSADEPTVAQACRDASALNGVAAAHPDYLRPGRVRSVSDDPWADDQSQATEVCLGGAQSYTTGTPQVVIAVIDDGFDLAHEDLDVRRISPAAWDFLDGDDDPSPGPGDDHGTSVAGIAVAAADNGVGIVGMCPDCTLLPIRRGATDSDDIRALQHASDAGAHVINLSWGYPSPSAGVAAAVREASRRGRQGRGAVVVVAAGNEGIDIDDSGDLAALDGALAVAAVDSAGEALDWSNHGASIDLAAPGEHLPTLDRTDGGYAAGGYTDRLSGTSAAAPVVAGIAGLVFSIDPKADARAVEALLFAGAEQLGGGYDASGRSPTHGFGRVNALRSVVLAMEAQGQTPQPLSELGGDPCALHQPGCSAGGAPAAPIAAALLSLMVLAVRARQRARGSLREKRVC